MESRTSPGKKGSVQPISECRAGGVCQWLSGCTLSAPAWPSTGDSGRDRLPSFHGPLVFRRTLSTPGVFLP